MNPALPKRTQEYVGKGGVKAVILAAGYATRLYPLTLNKPKCLLAVGGRTILDTLCDKLSGLKNLDELILVTNAKFFDQLSDWKKDTKLRLAIRVLNDGTVSNETRLGAIGDLRYVIQQCRLRADILMLASDNLFDAGLSDFEDFALSKKGAVSVGLYDIKDPALAAKKFGVLEINGASEVIGMEEKPEFPKSSLIGMGVYYFPEDSLKLIDEYLSQPDVSDTLLRQGFGAASLEASAKKDAPGYYIRWLNGRVKIFGFLFSGMWYDIGNLKALEDANRAFQDKNYLRERK